MLLHDACAFVCVMIDLSMDCFEQNDGTKHQKEANQARQSHVIRA